MTKEKADSSIRAAWICGIISTAITLIATLIGVFRGGLNFSGFHFSLFTFIDVFLMGGLTVGIFFKSRVCAVLMLAYFMWCKYVQWHVGVGAVPIVMGLLFLYFYAQGAWGTFVYHALKKKEAGGPKLQP